MESWASSTGRGQSGVGCPRRLAGRRGTGSSAEVGVHSPLDRPLDRRRWRRPLGSRAGAQRVGWCIARRPRWEAFARR